jgi:tetratricopeptide (TPR) repeat protein
MRSLALVIALTAVASARPEHLPAKLAGAASDAFAKAQTAEQAGDLQEAIRQYRRANEIAPHANTYFNLAELFVATKSYDAAIASYQKYLELAPDAPNHATVEKRVHELVALPGTLEITTDEPNAVMFVNGKASGAPRKLEVPAGDYQIDIVTPITFGGNVCSVSRGQSSSCHPPTRARVDGNVVISASWRMGGLDWPVEHQRFQIHGRFVAKPGHYDLKVHQRGCEALPLEVPTGDVVTYAYITYPDPEPDYPTCIPLTIEQQRVSFPK